MADGTTLPGTGVVVQDDDVTTVNGTTVASSKVQRIKIDSGGVDGSHRDTGPMFPFPIASFDGDLALPVSLTSYREQVVSPRYTVLADSIADGLASFWTQTNSNGGSVSVASGEGLLQTSAAANGSSQLISAVPIYYPGQSHWNIAAARFGDTGVAGNIRRIGTFTVNGSGIPQDGFAFELNGTTLNAVTFKAGAATSVGSTAWSKFATAPFTLDTNYHFWEERWTGNRVDFYVDGILRHTATGTSSPLTTTLNLPMAAQNINSTNATNVVAAIRNIGIGRFGTQDLVSQAALPNSTVVDRSGSIATGGTAQNLAVTNNFRTGLTIQNTHATADLWFTENGVTTAALNVGYLLPAGSTAKVSTQRAVSIWGATTAQTFAATEF